MNLRIRTIVALVVVISALGGFSLERSASAQLPEGNCLKVRGQTTEAFNGVNGVNSIITDAGILNGTAEILFDFGSGFLPTPNPSSFTYLADRTIQSVQGELSMRAISLDNVTATYIHTDISHIDPNSSTGRFAGATGVIYFRAESTDGGFNFQGSFNGEICLAN